MAPPPNGMQELMEQVELFEKTANLSASINDVHNTIDLLTTARAKIAADPQTAPLTLAKLQDPLKKSLEAAQKDIKPIYSGLGKYGKALDKRFKDKPLPTAENDALSSHPQLINRAIAMHLLREGEFSVASTFIQEANRHPPHAEPTLNTPNPYLNESWEKDIAEGTFNSEKLQEQFAEMYHILHELRQEKNLGPAIEWARARSDILEARGSNLEFELCRLQFVCLFSGHGTDGEDQLMDGTLHGPLQAWTYARREFGSFQRRYAKEVQKLMGALAYHENVPESPYGNYFSNDTAWEEVATSFTREFCSLLGLSADSPLYIAATAGAIALPHLLKLQSIMEKTRTEWTTQNELPVEIPLPPSYHFHSIFVCPVSKEQSTDQNPPMMMPCGHVIADESLQRLSKGARFKCPYCPSESHPRDAKKVFL
ncbi:hypothetical protein BU26DRAFT_521053 [Trematosphaeria pertusa]|uniref:GID complex catalytic subunit 2 n=1 Tax=Trematosphaeria pertusa TaxID=390896 RepID=A0A6A6IAN8_9PLEO|nr:uncharacterized protein BU26DRAFT_521053 [Trematosphaeria pertusa]KAF2246600.1 hypothetical protein BU26DRAFT_521053 [Trematosphaeria pertusa]